MKPLVKALRREVDRLGDENMLIEDSVEREVNYRLRQTLARLADDLAETGSVLCNANGGRGLGAGHECKCVREKDHDEETHGCPCGAMWRERREPERICAPTLCQDPNDCSAHDHVPTDPTIKPMGYGSGV